MVDKQGAVTFKGEPMTLTGQAEVKVGDKAPHFELTGPDLKTHSLDEYKGKVLLLTTVPSLDTSVCNTMTQRFNEEAAKLGDDVEVLVVSNDLPFAQKRWCNEVGCDNAVCLSDYMDHGFQDAWGLRIRELGLIARSVSVIDKDGKVVYHELVKEVADEPDYEKALEAARNAAG